MKRRSLYRHGPAIADSMEPHAKPFPLRCELNYPGSAMTNLSEIERLLRGESLDADPTETREWLDAFDTLLANAATSARATCCSG